MDVLRTCINPAKIVQALKSLPKTLDETYERVLLSIPTDRSKDALRILQWLVFSARPLRIDEVAELLVADPERSPEFDLERRPFDPEEIASYCGSLVTIQTSTKEIRLAHYSVQEFLVSGRLTSGCEIYKIIKQPANDSIAKTCLAYLMGAFESSLPVMPSELLLAEYAARYWIEHAKAAEDTYINDIDYRIVRFLECELARSNWIQLYDPEEPWKGPKKEDEVRVVNPPLYCASLAGLQGPVKILLDNGADVNVQSGGRGSALRAASSGGVQLLLDNGADVNEQSGGHGNALHAASVERSMRWCIKLEFIVNRRGASTSIYNTDKVEQVAYRSFQQHRARGMKRWCSCYSTRGRTSTRRVDTTAMRYTQHRVGDIRR
jgi:hypothetical protein